jgi:DnaD/phage-associated family protein
MRTININTAYLHTSVPNSFIDGYLTKANPMYSVIYLYFYRNCHSGSCSVTTASVAETFGILETDVVNCLKYWEKTGLIRLVGEDEECSIEFIAPQAAQTVSTAAALTVSPAAKPAVIQLPTALPAKLPRPGKKPVSVSSRPVYTVDELELYQDECPEVARLFSAAEQAFGKLHHYNDFCVVFGIYDWLRLPIEVIELLLGHCAAGGKQINMRYVERVAVDWAERGITDIEAAKEYILQSAEGYRDVMKALGRGGRSPAPKEREYIDKWLREYAMPLPVVLEACDRTIIKTDKGVFAYCDKIIAAWREKGVASLEDVNRVSAEYSQAAGAAVSGGTTRGVPVVRKPTRFANFNQREYDQNERERMELAYLDLGRDKRVKL